MKYGDLLVGAFILATLYTSTLQAFSTAESRTYWAGVVEFSSELYNQTSAERVTNAVNAYIDIIESPEANQVDIIVFPESTLNSIHQGFAVPDPSEDISPCEQSDNEWDPALRKISCSASRSKKYVVINITEKKEGIFNGQNQTLHYNANVVFDRTGTVISRYRKYNLFGEAGINVTETADLSYFETDFNVTFGHFICFDLLFKEPALKLMENQDIHDIVYPTMWFSELPFLTAVQAQNMWATIEQVNFLASGASNPSVGSTGSGIYSKNGPIVAIMSGAPQRKLLVAEVPKKQYWEDASVMKTIQSAQTESTKVEEILMKRDHLGVYASKMLHFLDGTSTTKENLCHKDLCCDFEIKVFKSEGNVNARSYRHSIVVFDGVRSYDGFATGGTFACALISCLNATLDSCGLLYESEANVDYDVTFEAVNITAKLISSENRLAFPNTVDYKLLPLPKGGFSFDESEEFEDKEMTFKTISLSLTKPNSAIYTFGIYGRDFDKDGMEPSPANTLLFNIKLIAMLFAVAVKCI